MTKHDYKFTDQLQLRIVNSTKKAAEGKLTLFFEKVNEIAYGMGIRLDHGKAIRCEESD